MEEENLTFSLGLLINLYKTQLQSASQNTN